MFLLVLRSTLVLFMDYSNIMIVILDPYFICYPCYTCLGVCLCSSSGKYMCVRRIMLRTVLCHGTSLAFLMDAPAIARIVGVLSNGISVVLRPFGSVKCGLSHGVAVVVRHHIRGRWEMSDSSPILRNPPRPATHVGLLAGNVCYVMPKLVLLCTWVHLTFI